VFLVEFILFTHYYCSFYQNKWEQIVSNNAYLQTPALHNDSIVFITDDDLWSVNKLGGQAFRLTTSKGRSSHPKISPDGQWIAYLSDDHGQQDIYLIPFKGGVPKRLTHMGVIKLTGWSHNNLIHFASEYESRPRHPLLRSVDAKTLEVKTLPWGEATDFLIDGKVQVIGRNNGDPARWKRYRGGTAGTFWIDTEGKGKFKQILSKLPSNLTCPRLIGGRLFFISDHEGIGNIYSCLLNGRSLKRHTNQKEYYVRHFEFSEGTLSYNAGAEIFLHDIKSNTCRKIEIYVASTFNQALPRFECSSSYLQEFSIGSNSQKISITSRGQLYIFSPWSGGTIRLGKDHTRYRHPTLMKNKKGEECLVAVELDHESEETLKLWDLETRESKTLADKQDWGKIRTLSPSPKGNHLIITNNRAQIFYFEISTGQVHEIEKNKFSDILSVSWSPHGDVVAYSSPVDRARRGIKVYSLKTKKLRLLAQPILSDDDPSFDADGKYLYFGGIREFHPNYSETHFELSFPFATQIYAFVLDKDIPNPLEQYRDVEDEDSKGDDEDESKDKDKKKNVKKGKKKKEILTTKIDWEGIEDRIISLPGALGGHVSIWASKDKVFAFKRNVSGDNPHANWMDEENVVDMHCFDLKERKWEKWEEKVHQYSPASDGKNILVTSDGDLRVINVENKPSDGDDLNKKDGWVDLSRVKVKIDPKKEWKQMYQEAWVLQREHFWVPDMSKINWQKVYTRYLPLLEKVHTRRELSDLLWEMQGELGTSHCYEFMGDYNRRPAFHPSGSLAAQFKYRPQAKAMEITKLGKGDSWIKSSSSPLKATQLGLKEGDLILGIDGRAIENGQTLYQHLEGRGHQEIEIEIKRKGKKQKETLTVNSLGSSSMTHYRDWVDSNRDYVHKKSKGKLGYIHIPNMAVWGFSEFYRQFLTERIYEGLVVDVRYNGGGHVSQHILKILAQPVLGFDRTRHFDVELYPEYAINGPLVCLTNEQAGSDGDIFSHSWKLMKLGKLIGKRTWGGVVGIWPRHDLNDGTMTTQPEYSFWFKDVGWDVENYGTDPDIEVEITPQDYKAGKDPQMDKAIQVALADIRKSPPLRPNLEKGRPNLKLPNLPKA
jgi:tricorn protease